MVQLFFFLSFCSNGVFTLRTFDFIKINSRVLMCDSLFFNPFRVREKLVGLYLPSSPAPAVKKKNERECGFIDFKKYG